MFSVQSQSEKRFGRDFYYRDVLPETVESDFNEYGFEQTKDSRTS